MTPSFRRKAFHEAESIFEDVMLFRARLALSGLGLDPGAVRAFAVDMKKIDALKTAAQSR